jgi:hypothetical protein
MEPPQGRARRPAIRLLLQRLEALLFERHQIIFELEMLGPGDGREANMLERRLAQVASEQEQLLDELDALVGVGGENAAQRA